MAQQQRTKEGVERYYQTRDRARLRAKRLLDRTRSGIGAITEEGLAQLLTSFALGERKLWVGNGGAGAEVPAPAAAAEPVREVRAPNPLDRARHNFTYHPPKLDQVDRYDLLRDRGYALAEEIIRRTKPSREQGTALRKVEEAVMWANAAIARNE